ncbi:hypothetical protein [Granulicella sp. L60]|uniref:hypothetical protein n=1 Tax=Granulicella sp. L60 TaxID=1641866 RepID=UPI00131D4E04|nr:hypothetical protein [Granulicella sp. L60]
MLTSIFIALALFFGYAVTVGLSMAATFGIASASHDFIVKDYRIRRRFKFLQDGIWLVCSVAGGYVTALIANIIFHPWIAGAGLATILVIVLWVNAWEMRQRGVPHQVAMSVLTVAGVVLGLMMHPLPPS